MTPNFEEGKVKRKLIIRRDKEKEKEKERNWLLMDLKEKENIHDHDFPGNFSKLLVSPVWTMKFGVQPEAILITKN